MRELCAAGDVLPGKGKEASLDTPGGRRHYALFSDHGELVAYLNSCPHQGRNLAFAPDEFLFGQDGRLVCPHHGAIFDIASGECMDGPCRGAALTRVPIKEQDGKIYLL